MEVDIEEDDNKPGLTYPYEKVDPLNPPPPASESELEDVNEVENLIDSEDETVPASVYEVGESFTVLFLEKMTAHALVKKKGKEKDKFYGKLILDLGNEVRSSVEQGTTAMEKLVERLDNVVEKSECKKLNKELEEEKLSNTFLQMARKGFMFEERPNEAIDVPVEDVESSSTKASRGKSG
ncbi:hypothetical protein Tco_1482308 [Tanacetum coccineum]